MVPNLSQQLGRYTLIRRLASGGMGEIYLGESLGAANFKKQVAIKRILPHLASNPDFVARFIDEANVMVQLHHGNIVSVLELGDQDGELYLVMDYLPGRDLKAVIHALRRSGELMSPQLALWVVAEVCEGLDYAHRMTDPQGHPLGIVHRDVSPSNILLGASGVVKLTDFGIARAEGRLQNSISGALQGKFVYMSPEQAEGQKLTSQSDVFSAGLVLYELLCGVRPFEGESDTETLRLARTLDIPPPSNHRPELDTTVDEIVSKALSRSQGNRFESAAEMARTIRHYLALNKSTVGADGLREFLNILFGSRVVPHETETPRSIDDALNMQLNALTPSLESVMGTQTGTGPSSPWSNGSSSVPSIVGSNSNHSQPIGPYESADTPSISTHPPSGHVPQATGRKRALALGLLLGIVTALAVFTWKQQPEELPISVSISPVDAKAVEILVDGARFSSGDPLVVGRMYTVCAVAQGFEKTCSRVRIQQSSKEVELVLNPVPLLHPYVRPQDIPHSIMVDQVLAKEWPMAVLLNREYVVCVEAKGYESSHPCQRVVIKKGLNTPQFVLTKKVPISAPNTPIDPKTPAAQSPKTERQTRPRSRKNRLASKTNKAESVQIKSIPTARVWRGTEVLGTTPLKVRKEKSRVTYVLKAKGYADTEFIVQPDEKRRSIAVPLQRPAYITMRVFPPASEIWLDDHRVGKGYLSRFPVRPGRHKLELRYYQGSTLVDQEGPLTIITTAGEEKRLKPITLSKISKP